MSAATTVEGARRAFASGRTRPLAWRRAQLAAIGRMLRDNGPAIRAALGADLGKGAVDTQLTEVETVRLEAARAARNLARWAAPRRVRAGLLVGTARASIHRDPLGVVLIIAPWNYPLHLSLMPLIGALAAGNAAVVKPSELAPATAGLIVDLAARYLDRDAIRVVTGGPAETTDLLTNRFDHIFFTGNARVGSIVLRAAAEHLTPVTLELGGKSPVWVDDSVRLNAAAASIAWGKFSNAGQTCVAPDYVLTTPDLVRPLADAIAAKARAMYGPDPRQSPDFGRIVTVRHAERLAALLGSGTVVTGGQADTADRYVAPTVLADVDPASPVMAEEIFGPILPILAVEDLDAAIDFITARPKPLALYGFTTRRATREKLLARTSSGGAGFNLTITQLMAPALPFGGVGASGMGRYHGEFTMATFSHEKAVLRKLPGPNPAALTHPPVAGLIRRALLR